MDHQGSASGPRPGIPAARIAAQRSQHLLLVTETYPPEINGVALTVECLRLNLERLGHRVTLVRPRQAAERATASTDAHTLLVRGLSIPRYAGLQFGLPAGLRLRRYIREQHVDAVYVATEGPLGWSAVGAARACTVPVACGFHTRFDDYLKHYGAAFLTRTALAWMRRFHNRASCTLVPTIELKQWLLGKGLARVELLRRGVDTTRFHPGHRDLDLRTALGVNERAPLVTFVGRLAPEKNLELVAAAFARIAALAPGARMLWIGDGPAREQLQQQFPQHVFAGTLRGAALATHFASADLFLFPSQTETFGNVTLEAMASGLTVCAFDYAAAHEHIHSGDTGELARGAEAADFMHAAETAARGWLAGVRLGNAARAAVEHLNPLRVAADFADLMSELTTRARVRAQRERIRHVTLNPSLL